MITGYQNKFIFYLLKRVFFVILMNALVFTPYQNLAFAASKKNKPLYAAFVMDADTGLILHQENAGKKTHPASLTKMMTLLMVFDALDQKKIKLSDPVVFSSHSASMPPSKLGIKPGKSITVEDAVYALVTKSANDVAAAVGEKLGGSEARFAALMTKKARALGMSNTTFKNASGLHHADQITTARDFARLSLVLIRNYPKYYRYFSTKNFLFKGASYHNHNRLMNTYDGMDGIKTGFINQSGFNLAASAKRDGHRLIAVVLGGSSAKARNDRMARLLDDGFEKIASLSPRQNKRENEIIAKNSIVDEEDNVTDSKYNLEETTSEQGDTDSIPLPRQKPIYVAGLGQVYGHKQSPQYNNTQQSLGTLSTKQSTNLRKQAVENQRIASESAVTTNQGNEWAIQIGAFSNRDSTNAAIDKSLRKLPATLRNANPVVAPIQAENGAWVFRARLSGYSKQGALKACSILGDCMPIAPQ